MREIKFRGKRKHANKWIYGYYSATHSIFVEDIEDDLPVRRETVGQCIGREDKHCVDIYEGDIVKNFSGRICEVRWFSSAVYCGWDLVPVNGRGKPHTNLWEDIEVVGNIHDKPEILKGTDNAT